MQSTQPSVGSALINCMTCLCQGATFIHSICILTHANDNNVTYIITKNSILFVYLCFVFLVFLSFNLCPNMWLSLVYVKFQRYLFMFVAELSVMYFLWEWCDLLFVPLKAIKKVRKCDFIPHKFIGWHKIADTLTLCKAMVITWKYADTESSDLNVCCYWHIQQLWIRLTFNAWL